MANQTPYQWLAVHQDRAEQLGQNEAMDYLEADALTGARWLLCQLDGLRSLFAFCLAAGGEMVVLTDGGRVDSGRSP